ncbi:hypothetical protein ACWEOE_33225 [Amycolatopsis sp. NPDC004368]
MPNVSLQKNQPSTSYSFFVTDNGPSMTCAPAQAFHTYRYRGGDPVTVPVGPGRHGERRPHPAHHRFPVPDRDHHSFTPRSAAPPLTCDASGAIRPGQPVHCTLTRVQPGLAAYGSTVETSYGTGPDVTLAPGPDGTGAFDVTPPADQAQYVLVVRAWSTNGAGLRTDTSVTLFWVDAAAASRLAKAV